MLVSNPWRNEVLRHFTEPRCRTRSIRPGSEQQPPRQRHSEALQRTALNCAGPAQRCVADLHQAAVFSRRTPPEVELYLCDIRESCSGVAGPDPAEQVASCIQTNPGKDLRTCRGFALPRSSSGEGRRCESALANPQTTSLARSLPCNGSPAGIGSFCRQVISRVFLLFFLRLFLPARPRARPIPGLITRRRGHRRDTDFAILAHQLVRRTLWALGPLVHMRLINSAARFCKPKPLPHVCARLPFP
jgi:hypothetical protein